MPADTGDLFAGLLPSVAKSRGRSGKSTRPAEPATGAVLPASGPEPWALTAYCDGGARGNPGPAGFGAEIRDGNGMVVAELSEFLGVATNNVAEYSGLLACLQYALDHNAASLSVVSDSELMVKQIQGGYKVSSPDLRPLWTEARKRIAKLKRFEIAHALRHKNKAADRLANEAMDRGTKRPHPAGSPAPPPVRATPYPNAGKSRQPIGEAATLRPAAPEAVPIVRGGGAPTNAPSGIATSAEPARGGSAGTPAPQQMLRGFTRDGVIHILGSHTLPDGRFVKIIPE